MKTYDLDQATLFIELVRVTRIHQKSYFASKKREDLIRSKDGENRIDLFLSGSRLNYDLTIIKKVVQADLFDEQGNF